MLASQLLRTSLSFCCQSGSYNQIQIPWAQRMAVIAVFALGAFVVITSCLRVTTIDILATSTDMTYDISNVMWTIIEPSVAIVCACLPILRPLVVVWFPSLKSKGSKFRSYPAPSYGNGSRSRPTPGGSQVRDKGDADEYTGAKPNGVQMVNIARPNSRTGSEDDMLRANRNFHDRRGIHRTVEYSVNYSHP